MFKSVLLKPLPICKYKSLQPPCIPLVHEVSSNFCTWFLCSSAQFAELSWLSTFSWFCQNCNCFEVLKIHNVSMWCITWLFLFMLRIFLNQSNIFVTSWLFYNSKSSKPNKSSSLFERQNKRLLIGLLVILSELLSSPLQWPEFVLARAFIGAFFSLMKNVLN